MQKRFSGGHCVAVRALARCSVSLVALSIYPAFAATSQLPPVEVEAPKMKPQPRKVVPAKGTASVARYRHPAIKVAVPRPSTKIAAPAPAPVHVAPVQPSVRPQEGHLGISGVYTNSTSVATKTNTPLLNIPQSINVVNHNQIRDQAPENLTDVTRYVPGVAVHQGEGNRDELVIRGVDSSANFYVNGFRDDVQFFRDLYNTESIEVLKGPSALTFGRGGGGGLLNRTLKEADGVPIFETVVTGGSYADKRVTVDAGRAINEFVAARINMMYENSDTFRDFGHLERYGINPTITWSPTGDTSVKLSYEHFHDRRTADRGNPSQGLSAVAPSSTRFNPATPFAPGGDLTTVFDSPSLNFTRADVNTAMAVVDHNFGNGLTVKNGLMYASYERFYQNVFPGGGVLSGAVNPADDAVNLSAYNHQTNRQNLIDQTDFVWKTSTGPLLHTVGFGSEFDRQTGADLRNTGFFPNGTNTLSVDPFAPTYFGGINFIHQLPNALAPGVTTPDSDSKYGLNTQSFYARDTIEIFRWLQIIGGARFDRFDFDATDWNTGTTRGRIDTKVSPQGAIVLKPIDSLSVYGAYSQTFLPASGDQFSALTGGTLILAPQGFENKEVGVKWNANSRLLLTADVYDLNRTNVPLSDPNNPGFFILSGKNHIRGFEAAANGYVTSQWQSTFGYALTDARVTSDTSSTIVAGNRVQLVPWSQVSWWNRYQFTDMWGVGAGVVYFSDSFAASDDTVKLPGFVRFDTAVYFRLNEHWRAQLNVENVFNKGYWASADGNNNISPGQPRTFRLSAVATF